MKTRRRASTGSMDRAREIAEPVVRHLAGAIEGMPPKQVAQVERVWRDENFLHLMTNRPQVVLQWIMLGETTGKVDHAQGHAIHSIIWAAEALRGNPAVEADDDARKYVERIHKNASALTAIHHSLTAVMSSGKPAELEEVSTQDLLAIISQSLEASHYSAVLPDMVRKQVAVEKTLDPKTPDVITDPHRIRLVLQNVFTNAIQSLETLKPTDEKKLVITVKPVRARVRGKRGTFVEITVSDTGAGFDPKDRRKLFELFYTTKGEYGTGLGVPTNRDIMETELGGLFDLNSPGEGKGATARILIPAKKGVTRSRARPIPCPP